MEDFPPFFKGRRFLFAFLATKLTMNWGLIKKKERKVRGKGNEFTPQASCIPFTVEPSENVYQTHFDRVVSLVSVSIHLKLYKRLLFIFYLKGMMNEGYEMGERTTDVVEMDEVVIGVKAPKNKDDGQNSKGNGEVIQGDLKDVYVR